MAQSKQMTPQQQAKELVDKFYRFASSGKTDSHIILMSNAKECALICVEEIINLCAEGLSETKYWQSVKEEINKL